MPRFAECAQTRLRFMKSMETLDKDVLIIGGGIAGLSCARELSRLGRTSLVIEKAPFLGGHVANFACKATDQCQRCGACLLEDVLEEVDRSELVSTIVRSEVAQVSRSNGGFDVLVSRRPPRIRPELCSDCGKCVAGCPAPGALVRSPFDYQMVINEDRCLFYSGQSCRICVEGCPEGAISLDGEPNDISVNVGAVVLACGYQAFDPNEKPRFAYGRVPGVITALELDAMLRADNFAAAGAGGGMRSVAFIQCVGSRDVKLKKNYCSTVCCGYALRMARLLRHRFSGIEPSMFYMDIQTFDRDFEARLTAAAGEVNLIRAIPSEIRRGDDDRPQLVFQSGDTERFVESFDLVVLSIGISPSKSAGLFSELLGISLNEDGFLGRGGEDVSTSADGVFVTGTIHGPGSIEHSVSQSIRAAGDTATYLQDRRA